MPGCPDAAVDSGGATPAVPASGTTRGSSPRHTGAEGDGVPQGVPLDESVLLRVPDAVRELVRVRERVTLGDALRRDATLSPRYVKRETASPPPPPPPTAAAASHSADSYTALAIVLEGTS